MFDVLKKLLKIHLAGEISLKDGNTIICDGDLAEGVNVSINSPDGIIPLPDGDYELETGQVISVKDGKIVSIIDVLDDTEVPDNSPIEPEMAEPISEPAPESTSTDPVIDEVEEPKINVEEILSKMEELNKRITELESKINLSSEIETKMASEIEFIKNKTTLATELKKSKIIEDTVFNRFDVIKDLKNNKK